MGRIKTKLVKRFSHEIFEKFDKDLSNDFEKNKILVRDNTNASKKMRNVIAGYLTRLFQNKKEI